MVIITNALHMTSSEKPEAFPLGIRTREEESQEPETTFPGWSGAG